MACRDAHKMKNTGAFLSNSVLTEKTEIPKAEDGVERLIFGVDSQTPAGTLLQNNIDHFEWVVRNKIYPGFAGRALLGKDCLTKEEIEFLHDRECKIAATCPADMEKDGETQGREQAGMYESADDGTQKLPCRAVFERVAASANF